VNEAFKKNFTPGTFAYAISMVEKEGVAVHSRDRVLEVGRAAWARDVKPLKQNDTPTKLLASLPTPGTVVSTEVDPDLEITQAWLSNGVRVHHRYMDYKKDTVFVSVSLAGGQIEESPDNAGITGVAALVVSEPATNRLSSTNVRDIMTGKNINVSGFPAGDNLMIRITGSPEDLEQGLQLVYALLTDGKLEESAFDNWKLQTLQRIDMMNRMPMFKAFESMAELLGGGDPRLTPINKEKVERQTLASAQAWFDKLRESAPIEVAIVGDIKLDKAMSLARRYLGSLNERPRQADALDKLRTLPRSTGPLLSALKVDTMTPQAMAIAGFIGCEGKNAHDTRALELAAHVMSSRLVKRIREDLSLVYSIRASSNPSRIYNDSGRFMSGAPCDPKNVDKVVSEVFTMFDDFAKKGPTDVELSNAKKQVANNLDTDMREPSYWWNILQHYDLHHFNLTEEKREKQAYQRFTANEVTGVFRKYYTPERRFQITAVPDKAETKSGDQDQKEKGKKAHDRMGMVAPQVPQGSVGA